MSDARYLVDREKLIDLLNKTRCEYKVRHGEKADRIITRIKSLIYDSSEEEVPNEDCVYVVETKDGKSYTYDIPRVSVAEYTTSIAIYTRYTKSEPKNLYDLWNHDVVRRVRKVPRSEAKLLLKDEVEDE